MEKKKLYLKRMYKSSSEFTKEDIEKSITTDILWEIVENKHKPYEIDFENSIIEYTIDGSNYKASFKEFLVLEVLLFRFQTLNEIDNFIRNEYKILETKIKECETIIKEYETSHVIFNNYNPRKLKEMKLNNNTNETIG